ncbi:MAG: type II secretion system minor pseudopilin GspJ [Acidiferrobacterales bacterium]
MQQRGFTLLEVLIAMGIFAIVSAISYGTLIRVLDHQQILEQERAMWRSLSLAMLRIEDDLGHTRERTVRDIYGTEIPAFLGQPSDSRAVSPPTLEFTRGGQWVLAAGTNAGIQRVAYRLHEGKLLREVWPSLDRSPTSEPRATPLLHDVEEFEVRFYAPDKKWVSHWPIPGVADILPRGVEVSLTLQNRETIIRLFVVNE